jgi:hypothetical protein
VLPTSGEKSFRTKVARRFALHRRKKAIATTGNGSHIDGVVEWIVMRDA